MFVEKVLLLEDHRLIVPVTDEVVGLDLDLGAVVLLFRFVKDLKTVLENN